MPRRSPPRPALFPAALPVLDRAQGRLDDITRQGATGDGADFVEPCGGTGGDTACDDAGRGIGGPPEESALELLGSRIPRCARPGEKGRNLRARRVATPTGRVLDRWRVARSRRPLLRHGVAPLTPEGA
ncbi:hypothetical protein [Streptomyces griseus]|uniref:hypothetical protein n=1 Tax=Streptomyces griseus TaxID=1911 RepID=UPI0004CC3CA4|nr:hypothetical protein [Streptomyces griseus]